MEHTGAVNDVRGRTKPFATITGNDVSRHSALMGALVADVGVAVSATRKKANATTPPAVAGSVHRGPSRIRQMCLGLSRSLSEHTRLLLRCWIDG